MNDDTSTTEIADWMKNVTSEGVACKTGSLAIHQAKTSRIIPLA